MTRRVTWLCLLLALALTRGAAAEAPTGLVAAARGILSAYQRVDPEPAAATLRIVAWRSSDQPFPADQHARLERTMEHIRAFYAREMERNGLGPLTFALEQDAAGRLVVHEVTGRGPASEYRQDGPSGARIREDCWTALRAAGRDPDRETVVIFTNLADWDPVALTFSHHSPYQGSGTARGGIAWQLDHAGLDPTNLPLTAPMLRDREYGRISLGRHNSIFLGGIAHELGHALGLPHACATDEEAGRLGTALMGSGNRTYGQELRGEGKGTFLLPAHALRLASHPLFSGSRKGLDARVTAGFSQLSVSAGARAFAVSGTVTASVPVYAVVAYLDPEGGSDYDARTAVGVPGPDGCFAIDCEGLVRGRPAVLRLVACLANGQTFERPFAYRVRADGSPDTEALEVAFALDPFLLALDRSYRAAVVLRDALPADSRVRRLATSVLESRWNRPPTNAPSTVATNVTAIPLSRAKPMQAQVGWWKPTWDGLPGRDALLIAGGEVFDTGLYAHAPARYRYELGGSWSRLVGACGLPHQRPLGSGSVVFVIQADGREVLRTHRIDLSVPQRFDIDLSGVRELELTTEDAGDGTHNDWGLWLGAELQR